MKTMQSLLHPALATLVCGLAACKGERQAPTTPPAAAAGLETFVLQAPPGQGLEVLAAKQAGNADKVVVQGRVANIVKGYAAFTLMDSKLPYCGESNPEDKCKTPWDYCCEKPATRTQNAMVIELRDPSGKPIATPALPELRLLDVVTVVGKLTVDADGNAILAASGYYRQARPELPSYVRWPQ
jgi:hypothetical protein